MQNKTIHWTASLLIGGSLLAVSLVSAQTTPLTASCAGSASSSTITWTVSASGGIAPYSYLWLSGDGVAGSTSTSMAVTYATNGTRSVSARVSDTSTSTATTTCMAAVTSFPTSSTSTPSVRKVQPKLQIEQNGKFLAHGMIVQSVSTNSFTGTVWGVTYTVNVNTSGVPEFFLEKDKGASRLFNLSQIHVGDQLGVSGWVSAGSPLMVDAKVIRNYSLTSLRQNKPEKEDHDNRDKKDNSSSSVNEIRGRLDNLLKQLQNLQGIFKNRSGGGGNI